MDGFGIFVATFVWEVLIVLFTCLGVAFFALALYGGKDEWQDDWSEDEWR